MEPEDFEEYIKDAENRYKEHLIKEKEKEFSEGCLEGYSFIKENGWEYIEPKDSTEEAIQRMLGYFIQIEHYEKCAFLKKVFVEVFKKEPTPIFPTFLEKDHE
jgi:hypothetical protein